MNTPSGARLGAGRLCCSFLRAHGPLDDTVTCLATHNKNFVTASVGSPSSKQTVKVDLDLDLVKIDADLLLQTHDGRKRGTLSPSPPRSPRRNLRRKSHRPSGNLRGDTSSHTSSTSTADSPRKNVGFGQTVHVTGALRHGEFWCQSPEVLPCKWTVSASNSSKSTSKPTLSVTGGQPASRSWTRFMFSLCPRPNSVYFASSLLQRLTRSNGGKWKSKPPARTMRKSRMVV